MSECDREASTVRNSSRRCCGMGKEFSKVLLLFAASDTNLRHALQKYIQFCRKTTRRMGAEPNTKS